MKEKVGVAQGEPAPRFFSSEILQLPSGRAFLD
jgi:hypothetical protein